MADAGARDHLFVSYAGEDWAPADWLTRKLTAEGCRIWCDRFKLLGGEPYPADIDDAIKRRTFRMLALMSRSSVNKPNPRKERTLALNLARERGEPDFLIPLNVDGMKPTELDWMTTDLTFIPFNRSWADGLAQLLKKLQSIDVPRPLKDGRRIAIETFLAPDVVTAAPEPVYTNRLPVVHLPETVLRVRLDGPLPDSARDTLLRNWTYYATDPQTLHAFAPPLALPGDVRVQTVKPMPGQDPRAGMTVLRRSHEDGVSADFVPA